MEVERDYIMRLVKEIVRVLGFLVRGKKEEEDLEEEIQTLPIDGIFKFIIKLADRGNINEAENILFTQLDRTDMRHLYVAITFYEHVNEYTDEFLNGHDYTRDEILEGLKDIAKEYGVLEIISLLTH